MLFRSSPSSAPVLCPRSNAQPTLRHSVMVRSKITYEIQQEIPTRQAARIAAGLPPDSPELEEEDTAPMKVEEAKEAAQREPGLPEPGTKIIDISDDEYLAGGGSSGQQEELGQDWVLPI